MCLHEKYCSTSGRLRQIRRNQRARSLFDSKCTEKSFDNSCVEWADDSNQGFDTTRRFLIPASKKDRSFDFLGWTTNTIDMVQRNFTYINDGSSERLFMPSHNSRPASIIRDATRISPSKNKSLVIDLLIQLDQLTVARVVNYLNYAFKVGNNRIVINNLVTTPLKMLEDLPSLASFKASYIPIKFYGGPPIKIQQYEGTLLTFIVDCVMQAWYNGKREIVQYFLELK